MDASSVEVQIRRAEEWEYLADLTMAAIDTRLRFCKRDEPLVGFLPEEDLPPQARVIVRHACRRDFCREACLHAVRYEGRLRWYVDLDPRVEPPPLVN